MLHSRNWLHAIAVTTVLALGAATANAQNPPVRKDVLPPSPTVKLTEQQRHIVKELILKDLKVKPEAAPVPTRIGEKIPSGIPLQPIPVEVAVKVPKLRTYSFYVKDGQVVLVDTKENTVADVVH